jgi:anti-anti-sigma factor
MRPDTDRPPGLDFISHPQNGCTVAELSGELDIVCVPTLRGQLLGVLRPDTCRLIVDLSQVNFCDASGLAVLISTGRRAELLGGVLRLVAPTPPVMLVMHITGLHRRLDIFSTIRAATTRPESNQRSSHRVTGETTIEIAGPRPAIGHSETPDIDELRQATAALLADVDAWYEADPDRRFAPTLHVLARAYARSDHTALAQATRSLVSTLTRHPLTHSPAVAANASRLRRIVEPVGHLDSIDAAGLAVESSPGTVASRTIGSMGGLAAGYHRNHGG